MSLIDNFKPLTFTFPHVESFNFDYSNNRLECIDEQMSRIRIKLSGAKVLLNPLFRTQISVESRKNKTLAVLYLSPHNSLQYKSYMGGGMV